MKPVIGIVAKHYYNDHKRLETFIRDEVEQAIFDNGGIAIGILPPNEDKIKASSDWKEQLTTAEKHNLYEAISLCDGIILQGGGYADEYECFIAKYCHDYDIPILGICAGNQNMVRALGGTISRIEGLKHDSDDAYVHPIKINIDSKIYRIIGKEETMVNSRHNNYASNPGPLKITAYSDDGIPEVLEDNQKRFYVGVQFHPESLIKRDESMNKIFVSFIDVCSQYKNEKK
ncbi:MAG: gamma-glutamyl-gamma-aminobutyrate hydrolase family protein [Bacilli bacterium]|nr:gamma-glutamyl-gamma-aminobutyrate hydrolase family protein [Bacilli bacterium]